MKRYSILLIFFLFTVTSSLAQSFVWIDGEETGYEMNPSMAEYTVSVA